MFGYIQPMECELRVREQTLYRAAYCGLCRAIGARHGLIARMALNYDCAFLGLFYETLTGEGTLETGRCLVKPLKKKQPMFRESPALDYAADVNVLLAAYQKADDWTDDKKLSALGASVALKAAFEHAKSFHSKLADCIDTGLQKLSSIERARVSSADEPACAFGAILRDVAANYEGLPDRALAPTKWMFYNLGRWIYLMDAWDDREKDLRAGSYNPFICAKSTREDAAFQLYVSLSEAEKAYDLIEFKSDAGVLDNIMHLGCRFRTRRLIGEDEGEINESV